MISRGIIKFGLAGPTTLGLLLFSGACVAWGLSTITKEVNVWILWMFSALGILAGWLLATRKINPRWSLLITLISTLILFLVHDNNFVKALSDTSYSFIAFITVVIDDPSTLNEELPLLFSEISALSQAFYATVIHVSIWMEGFFNGKAAYDPFITRIFWTSAIWMSALWAGYSIRYKGDPILAMLPFGFLLAGSLNFVNGSAVTVLLFIAATLLLIPVLHYKRRQQAWLRTGTDYAEDISLDTGFATIPIIMLLLLIGTFIPVIKSRQLLLIGQEFYQTYAEKAENFGEVLGLEIQPETAGLYPSVRSPGLPREHLLGSGPELNQRVVMTIEVHDPAASLINRMKLRPSYYWRGFTYDRYTGTGWETTRVEEISYRAGESLFEEIAVDGQGARLLVQDVSRVQNTDMVAYAAGTIVQSDQDFHISWRLNDGDNMDIFAGTIGKDNYRMTSYLLEFSDEQLNNAKGDTPNWVLERYLQLPEKIPERVHSLGREITSSMRTPFEKAKAIETYLRQYEYSLQVSKPPRNRDVTDYFLFDLQKGYCDYYATAMVVLARSIGIPARLVIGYASGIYDAENDRYIITEANAHSWPELYLPGAGWIEFEPTGGLPLLERPGWDAPATDFQDLRPRQRLDLLESMRSITRQKITQILIIASPAFIAIIFWIFGESFKLQLLSPERSIRYAFEKLQRQAVPLTEPNFPGDTPNEFSTKLRDRLQRIAAGYAGVDGPQRYLLGLQDITNIYNLSMYSTQILGEADKRRILRMRWNLRWRIYFARFKIYFTNLIFFVIIRLRKVLHTGK